MNRKIFLTIISSTLLMNSIGFTVEVDHHTVDYLGKVDNLDGSSTALWAVTENGCAETTTTTVTAQRGKGGGGGGGGGKPEKENCNSMSHFAVSDFLCDEADLLWPQVGLLYTTITDAPGCGTTYNCLETVYNPGIGRSKPDGPGNWIKYSNHTSEPQTAQLAVGQTHVFGVTFYDDGRYIVGEDAVHAAIKSGKKVPVGVVDGPVSNCL